VRDRVVQMGRSWSSSPSSRRTSWRVAMGSGRRRARPRRWKPSARLATGATNSSSTPTSRPTSTASTQRS
jgi:hypothetical protein